MFKLLIIGLGGQGYKHFLAAKKLEDDNLLQIVGVCDFKNVNKIDKPFYNDYQKAIRELSPDAVIIATTNDTHFDISSFCIKNGVHVLKEKPMNLSIDEADKLLELAKENKCILKIAQQRLFKQSYIIAKDWLPSIGEVDLIDYKFTINDKTYSWYCDDKSGGGSWYGLGWHACFLMNWFFDNPKTISVVMKTINNIENVNVDNIDLATIYFNNGSMGRILTSSAYSKKQESFFIHGKQGSILIEDKDIFLYDNKGFVLQHNVINNNIVCPYTEQIKDFKNITSNKKYIDLLAYKSMRMLYAGIKSVQYNNQFIKI